MTEEKRKGSFDRGLNFDSIKARLINKASNLFKSYKKANRDMPLKQLCYCIVAMIQLRNGSRISEAVKAFKWFMDNNIDDDAEVKISKSDAVKVIKKDGKKKKIKLQARFRDIVFPEPEWIDRDFFECVKESDIIKTLAESSRLKKRVLDYLLKHFECNTHSLRYAFINHMLYKKKVEMGLVSKIVGHANVNQLVTYTQKKNAKSSLKKAGI